MNETPVVYKPPNGFWPKEIIFGMNPTRKGLRRKWYPVVRHHRNGYMGFTFSIYWLVFYVRVCTGV